MAEVKVTSYPSVQTAIEKGEFYAINTSDLGKTQRKGQIVLGVKTADGTVSKIVFPPTWIPIDLTSYVSPEDLKTATAFRDYVRNRLITLITKDSFLAMQKIPGYDREFKRVAEKLGNIAGNVTGEVSISVSSTASAESPANSIDAIETPLTAQILTANTDEELITVFNQNLQGLSLGEYRSLINKSTVGSFLNIVASEIEATISKGGLTIKSIEETETYKEWAALNKEMVEPQISF
jgi:hypothetical protein